MSTLEGYGPVAEKLRPSEMAEALIALAVFIRSGLPANNIEVDAELGISVEASTFLGFARWAHTVDADEYTESVERGFPVVSTTGEVAGHPIRVMFAMNQLAQDGAA